MSQIIMVNIYNFDLASHLQLIQTIAINDYTHFSFLLLVHCQWKTALALAIDN